VVARVVKDEASPPRSLNPDLPPDYDAAFKTALAKEPAARFPSARAFMVALGWQSGTAPDPLALPASNGTASTAPEGTLADPPTVPVHSRARSIGVRLALAAATLVAAALLAGYLRRPGATNSALTLPLPVPGSPVLSIETRPAGAQVLVDGRAAGVSPLLLDSLPLGVHTVKVTHPGYVPTELNVELRPGTGHVPLALPLLPLEVRAAGPAPARPSAPVFAPTPRPNPTAAALAAVPEPAGVAEAPAAAASLAPVPPAPSAPQGPTRDPQRISGAPPRYPDLARPLRQRGTVIVEMVVGESGEPRDLRIVESAGPLLDAAALDAVTGWRYEPARKAGVTVSAPIRVRLDFEPPAQ
jgi:protein TonB